MHTGGEDTVTFVISDLYVLCRFCSTIIIIIIIFFLGGRPPGGGGVLACAICNEH